MSARTLLWLAPWLGGSVAPLAAQSNFERGVEAYRQSDYAEAGARWQATLGETLDERSRARVYYDLGNAHWRLQQPLAAIACYSAAVRLDPRHEQAWQNLELTRAKNNLPPADAGDLGATFRRLLTQLRPSERRTLLFGALLFWAAALFFETRSGGSFVRAWLAIATLGLVGAALPWGYGHLRKERALPMLVVENGNVPLRGEPLESRDPIGELSALEEVERLDALPGWVRVRRADGLAGWVREGALFALQLENPEAPAQSE